MTNRRSPLALLVAGLVLLSGCLAGPAFESSPDPDIDTDGARTAITPNGAACEPIPLPTAPGNLTTATAGEFGVAYEEARMHNELVEKHPDIVRVGTRCDVESVDRLDGSYAVTVSCGHWYEFQHGDVVGIADGAPYTVTHVVGEDGIEHTGDREPSF